jgi:FkbM family methyltransferase
VIAIEPQPLCLRLLSLFYGRDSDVVIVPKAVGDNIKVGSMYISRSSPTVSTLSKDWMRSVKETKNFNKINWEEEITVSITTLEALISEFGLPVLTKIDVEGFEIEVLNGLSHQLPLISFEYIAVEIQRAIKCIQRLREIGSYEYNMTKREEFNLIFPQWMNSENILAVIRTIPTTISFGDIYCRLI